MTRENRGACLAQKTRGLASCLLSHHFFGYSSEKFDQIVNGDGGECGVAEDAECDAKDNGKDILVGGVDKEVVEKRPQSRKRNGKDYPPDKLCRKRPFAIKKG